MARKVKCQICGKELTNDVAFKVTKGKRNLYYCSQEEYKDMLGEKGRKDKFYQFLAEELHQKYIPPMMVKEINQLSETFSYETIKQTFIECRNTIQQFLQKNNYNIQYNTCRYIFAIIGNSIVQVDKQRQKDIQQLQQMFEPTVIEEESEIIDLPVVTPTHKINNKPKHDISSLLEDLC